MCQGHFRSCFRHKRRPAEIRRNGATALDVDYVLCTDGVSACRRHCDSGLPQVSLFN